MASVVSAAPTMSNEDVLHALLAKWTELPQAEVDRCNSAFAEESTRYHAAVSGSLTAVEAQSGGSPKTSHAQKKKKDKTPPGPSPGSQAAVVVEAIMALHERGGSSLMAIDKWITTHSPRVNLPRQRLTAVVKRCIDHGFVTRCKNSFKVTAHAAKAMTRKPGKRGRPSGGGGGSGSRNAARNSPGGVGGGSSGGSGSGSGADLDGGEHPDDDHINQDGADDWLDEGSDDLDSLFL